MGRQIPPYPLDLSPLLALQDGSLDESGVPCRVLADTHLAGYQPATIARYALAHWNAYVTTADEDHCRAFIAQARWLVAHEIRLPNEAGGWLNLSPRPEYHAFTPWLSALTQGNALSVLVRAHQLTSEPAFLHTARRAVRTFELDILDGGVNTPLGEHGVFFEEVAVYPAAHVLNGCIQALFGLYDYLALSGDASIAALIQRSLATLHAVIALFDTGYWSRQDLLSRRLASPSLHALHVHLLEALARYDADGDWATLAARWAGYQQRLPSRIRRSLASAAARSKRAFWSQIQRRFFRASGEHTPRAGVRVCIPITAFPVTGGMRSVLAGVALAMKDVWEIEYLTWRKGPHSEGLAIQTFGSAAASYWQFPNVWLYCFAGWRQLVSLLRRGQRYQIIFPQDGVYTGAFAALAARLAGVRVISMDHGNVTLPDSPIFRAERRHIIKAFRWPMRVLASLRLTCYWPSLHFLTRVATRYTDYLLPAGAAVEEAYQQQYGVHPSRMARVPFMIDSDRYAPADESERKALLLQRSMAPDAIVVLMVNRLAPEKGINMALEGFHQALQELSPELRARVRLIIAGDGPLRSQIEADICRYELHACCTLWGEADPDEVAALLRISNIFLYTSTRGINPVAVLEAMAAGLAVIASTAPRSLEQTLAEGRGIALPVGDTAAVSAALVQAINDGPRCRQMGRVAREYIAARHSAEALRRCLLRATYWSVHYAHDASEGV